MFNAVDRNWELVICIPMHELNIRLFGGSGPFRAYGFRIYRDIISFLWDKKEYTRSLPFLSWREIRGRYIDTLGNVYQTFDIHSETDNWRRPVYQITDKNNCPSVYFNVITGTKERIIRTIIYEVDLRYGEGWFSRFAGIIGNRTVRYLCLYYSYDVLLEWWYVADCKMLPNESRDDAMRRICADYGWEGCSRLP